MSLTVLDPMSLDQTLGQNRWMVTIFDNEETSMDEVVEILIQATRCTVEEAAIEMWEAHTFGKAPVHFHSAREECDRVASIIQTAGVKTAITPEWEN
jgi:ATP-dependent Clp protease adapter protein ClpS